MRKLESDIRRATKKYEYYKQQYEAAREALQKLTGLEEAVRLDSEGMKLNLRDVIQYGAFFGGVRRACCKILNDWFRNENAGNLSKKDDRLIFKAYLELAESSLLNAERWMGEEMEMMFEPVERDKKGTPTKYKASFYVNKTVRTKL